MSIPNVIYRVMKRSNDNSLVSPYTISPFLEISITSDNVQQIIPYGFAFYNIDKAKKVIYGGHPLYNAKLEIWAIEYESAINVEYELNSYHLHNYGKNYKDIINECFFNSNFLEMPIKIGCTIAPKNSIFCKNIELIEKIEQNY